MRDATGKVLHKGDKVYGFLVGTGEIMSLYFSHKIGMDVVKIKTDSGEIRTIPAHNCWPDVKAFDGRLGKARERQ